MRVYAAALTRHCHLLWGLHGHDPLGAPPSYNGRCDACTHFTDEGGRSRELISPAPELARGGMGTQAQPQAEDHALRVAGTPVRVCWVAQSCPTLCNPTDHSPPGPSAHGVSQARILEWLSISLSRGSSQPRDRTSISCVSCIGRRILYH